VSLTSHPQFVMNGFHAPSMKKDNKILIGIKGKKDYESIFHWETIERWWVENGEIKIWKREPFRYIIPKQK